MSLFFYIIIDFLFFQHLTINKRMPVPQYWTSIDVQQWLTSIGIDNEIREIFKKNNVTGRDMHFHSKLNYRNLLKPGVVSWKVRHHIITKSETISCPRKQMADELDKLRKVTSCDYLLNIETENSEQEYLRSVLNLNEDLWKFSNNIPVSPTALRIAKQVVTLKQNAADRLTELSATDGGES